MNVRTARIISYSNEGEHRMELKELQQHIRTLVTLEETEAPVISMYHSVLKGDGANRRFIDDRTQFVGDSLPPSAGEDFKQAMRRVTNFLESQLDQTTQGAAIFARAGKSPFFLALQFQVLLPSMIAVGSSANVYHLVELKDTYHRYVVVIINEMGARILEVNLGEVTKEIWSARPELRARIGRTWSREHYRHHKEEQMHEFIDEKIKIVDRLMAAGGHTHLIVAGNQQMAWQFRHALPYHLSAKFVDVVDALDSTQDVVTATIAEFIKREEQESLAVVDELLREIKRDGLAVAGTDATMEALRLGIVDVLVLAKGFDPQFEVKEQMVQLAERYGSTIEVVNESEALDRLGGVGCLLRYRVPASATEAAEQTASA
jgi:ribosomal protein L7Ae-like RNA K-turn-binding protein